MAQLPKSAFMTIWYSSFLIDVLGSYQSGYTQLQAAKQLTPSFLERFAIFCREQVRGKARQGATCCVRSLPAVCVPH